MMVKFIVRLAALRDVQIKLAQKKCQEIIKQLESICPKVELNKEIHQELRSFSFTLLKNKKKKL